MSAKQNSPRKKPEKPLTSFDSLDGLAAELRQRLKQDKETILLYAYNGTGKTRLSMAFKDAGKRGDHRDTLYFNAYTQDLFVWDNDLNNDTERFLKINRDSRFFDGLKELEMETRIRPFLHSHVDFDFTLDTEQGRVIFSRDVNGETFDGIKVSRGEENMFIWCFFLAITRLVLDRDVSYTWVKYIYIDDPVSSLDDNNIIALAHQLAQGIRQADRDVKIIVSTHHALFFNVMHNELEARKSKKIGSYFLSKSKDTAGYNLRYTNSTPFFHHVAMLTELHRAAESGQLYTHHFSMLRTLLEKSASFHGFKKFSDCIERDENDPDGVLYDRLINVLSHGGYSLYEPREMLDENKAHFRRILNGFLKRYPFNPEVFSDMTKPEQHPSDAV